MTFRAKISKKELRESRRIFLKKKNKELRSRQKISFDYKWKGYDDLLVTENERQEIKNKEDKQALCLKLYLFMMKLDTTITGFTYDVGFSNSFL
jgi:hypothetical protein